MVLGREIIEIDIYCLGIFAICTRFKVDSGTLGKFKNEKQSWYLRKKCVSPK